MLSGLPFLRPLALLADSQRTLIKEPRALSTGWYCPQVDAALGLALPGWLTR